MAVTINTTIDKTIETGPVYKAIFTVVSTIGVDKGLFVHDFPDLTFSAVVDTDTVSKYDLYDPLVPPAAGTNFVRLETVTLLCENLEQMILDIDTVKSKIETFATEFNIVLTSFTGTEAFNVVLP